VRASDILARAKNGTGKTGAYFIPCLEKIDIRGLLLIFGFSDVSAHAIKKRDFPVFGVAQSGVSLLTCPLAEMSFAIFIGFLHIRLKIILAKK
jgi:hypothetical protein